MGILNVVAESLSNTHGSIEAVEEGWRQKAQRALADLMGGDREDYRRAGRLMSVFDLVPVVGDAQAVADARDSFVSGDNVGGAVATVAAAIGIIPLVGDAAGKALKESANKLRENVPALERQLSAQIGDLPPLAGAPEVANIPTVGYTGLGQNRSIIDSAEQYAQNANIPLMSPDEYLPIDRPFSESAAKAYENMANDPTNPRVQASYNALADETMAQYDQMLSDGVKPFFIEGADPYAASPYLSLLDLTQNNRLGVFRTNSGAFGSDAGFDATSNPLLERASGYNIDGQPILINDAFRAVHDYYGHGKHGFGFRAMGEDNAYRSHSGMFSLEALPALASETRGQNSWVNFGRHGDSNRNASAGDTTYADQKTGLLPNNVIVPRTPLGDFRRQRALNSPLAEKLEGALTSEGNVGALHYSNRDLDVVDPNFYGTGLSRRTMSERNLSFNPEFVNRSFMGLDTTTKPYIKEAGLGSRKYESQLPIEQIYDLLEDPDNLKMLPEVGAAKEESFGDYYATLTKKIRDSGYSAVFQDHPKFGKFLQVFDPLTAKRLLGIPVAYIGTEAVRSTMQEDESSGALAL